MDTVYRFTRALRSTLNSRLFAASALAVVSAAIIFFVSININAVTIIDGDTSRVVLTLEDDPHRVVEHAGLTLKEGDRMVPAESAGILKIDRAADVQITADGISTLVRMSQGTVADALEKVGVQIGDNDKLNVPLDLAIDDDLDISVDRIAFQVYTVTETQKYTVDTDYTTTIPHGSAFIKRSGVDGSKTITYRKTIKNGELIKAETLKEVVNRKMVPQIKLVGTPKGTPQSVPPFQINLDSQGQPTNFKTKFTGRATAYSSDRGYAGNWTASGRRAEVGVVAVNPKKIPYGSKLYIVSPDGSYVYGYAIAGDTGLALMSGRCVVDLFFAHYEECLRFGARRLNVYVLE